MIDKKTGIWLSNDHKHWFDEGLADALCIFFKNNNSTVVDLGCGEGRYLKKFKQAGITCSGYDGNPDTKRLTDGMAFVLDISSPVVLKRFDWVLSLEVGEHIPRDKESIFIRNLYKHCRKGIILSWAPPGQGGEGHFNERPNSYIKKIFSDLGFSNDSTLENSFRRSSVLSWFTKNIMVFRRLR